MKRNTLVLGLLAAALLAGGTSGYLWWRAQARAEIFAAAIPAQPDLSHWPVPMQQRIAAAERKLVGSPLEGLAELSRLYHANGFFTEAAQCYAGLEQLQPAEARWCHLHALILAGYGDTEPALPLWQRAVALAPDYLPAHLRLGDVYLKRNDFPAAEKIYRAILAAHPDEPYAQLGVARCQFEAGHWENARALLEPLVAKTNYMLGYDLIVTVFERLGHEDQARAVRARNRDSGAYRDPVDPWADQLADDCYDVYRLSLASGAAQRNGDGPTSLRRIEQALVLAPTQATLHFQRASYFLEKKSYAKARQGFEQCTVLKPDFSDGWAQLAFVCETIGDRPAAERALVEGLKNCPNSPGLHLQKARWLVRDKRPAEALDEFRTSIRLRPNEADAYLGLATTLVGLGRNDEGMVAVDQALVAEPEHPGALSIRTFNAIVSGNELAARQWLRRCQNQPRIERKNVEQLLQAYAQQFGHAFK
jgi:tetratricopeptide (TPR) repeat protein